MACGVAPVGLRALSGVLTIALWPAGCEARSPAATASTVETVSLAPLPADPKPASPPTNQIETRYSPASRVVAFGDVHGDVAAARRVLRLVGAIDETDHWVGGSIHVVQTGDQLDRGDDDRLILDLFDRLTDEAEAVGGAFHALNGNHEYMNVLGDFRYVTPGGFGAFSEIEAVSNDVEVNRIAPNQRGRAAAFAPGGPYARRLARRNTVVIIGETVFVHGGIEPSYAPEIDNINRDARSWLLGASAVPGNIIETLMKPDSPVWTRTYSMPSVPQESCQALSASLRTMGVSRMVVGHTVQKEGITSACDAKVWRIDVGLAKHYGGPTQALEITRAGVTILSADVSPSG